MKVAGLIPILLAAAAPALGQAVPDPCDGRGTVLLVLTGPHEMRRCEWGQTAGWWRVALGAGGVDKRRQGDRKTPLGRYPIGRARPSRQFGLFIPIDYPTPEQRRQGYTGSDIGIHGPQRQYREMGAWNVSADWTWGCIAVASDDIINGLATWIRERQVRTVEIF